MNKIQARRHASDVLFNLVSALEPRVKPLGPWFLAIVELTEKWHASEGNQGVKRMKECLDLAWRTLLGENPPPLDFVKSKGGCPEVVLPLVKRVSSLTKDPRLLSAVQSLVRITDLWEGVPETGVVSKSLDIIVESRLPSSARDEIKKFGTFLKSFFEHYPDAPITRAYKKAFQISDANKFLYRQSRGPNGPLIGFAHLDVLSLHEAKLQDGSTLLGEVYRLMDLVGSLAVTSWRADREFSDLVLKSVSADTLKYRHSPGKLSLKAEKGGKLRIIAQPDYISQLAMVPIHNWLMDCLRAFPSDCTFDQAGAIPLICTWHSEGRETYSFDQSACTDRFPFEFQLEVVRNRFGTPVTESMQRVMADRDWEITLPNGRTRTVRWSVGQPLGMYGSWPLMALTHHLLVQYCSWLSRGKTFRKGKPFDKYVICGDDIVIADRLVAREYMRVAKRLGLVINEQKSHMPIKGQDQDRIAEFAKITVWRGHPLFPIRPKLVMSALADVRNAIPLLFDLAASGLWHARKSFLERWIRIVFPREKTFLTTLLTIPREFGGLGFRDDRSIRRLIDELKPGQIHPFLFYLAEKIRSLLKDEIPLIASHEQMISDFPPELVSRHPLTEYLREKGSELQRIQYRFGKEIPSVMDIVYHILLNGFQGLPTPWETRETPLRLEIVTEDQRQRDATLWHRAFAKERFIRAQKDPRTRRYERILCPSAGIEAMDFYHHFGQQWLDDRQYQVLSTAILGKRISSDDKSER